MTTQELTERWKRTEKRVEIMSVRISETTANMLEDLAASHGIAKSTIASDLLLVGLCMFEDEQKQKRTG